SSRRRHTRFSRDWSSDVCSSDLFAAVGVVEDQAGYAERALVLDAVDDRWRRVGGQGHADGAVVADDVDAPGGDPLVVHGLQAGFGRAVEDDAFQRLRRRTLGFGWRLRAGGGGRCEQQEAEAGGGGGVQAGGLVTWWRGRCDGF